MKSYEQNQSMTDGTPIGVIQQILFDEQTQAAAAPAPPPPQMYNPNVFPPNPTNPPNQHYMQPTVPDPVPNIVANENNLEARFTQQNVVKNVEQAHVKNVEQEHVKNVDIRVKHIAQKIFYGIIITLLCFVMLYSSGTKVSRAVLLSLLIGLIVTFVLMHEKKV